MAKKAARELPDPMAVKVTRSAEDRERARAKKKEPLLKKGDAAGRDYEHREQSLFIKWIDWEKKIDPRLECVFAVPNGFVKSIQMASWARAEGLRSGVPDVFVAVPIGKHSGLFLEFKSGKNDLSDTQREWFKRLANNGFVCCLVRSFEEAKEAVSQYLIGGKV